MTTMKAPSLNNLKTSFKGCITDKEALQIRAIVHAVDGDLEAVIMDAGNLPATQKWARSCHNNPFSNRGWRRTMMMSALSELLHGFDAESLYAKGQDKNDAGEWPRYIYVNRGDTYAATLIMDRDQNRVFIGCWGDLAERGLLAE